MILVKVLKSLPTIKTAKKIIRKKPTTEIVGFFNFSFYSLVGKDHIVF